MAGDERPACARWERLVTGRLAELERRSPSAGSVSGSFWDSRADRYAAAVKLAAPDRDPFLRRLRGLTDPASTVLDVGAGTGRYALGLAPGVGHVTAVDPSAAMLAVLRRDAQERAVANVEVVAATWQDARAAPADVAFSAFVLPLVADARRFLVKLDAAARRHALLYLGAYCLDAVLDPFWRHFHGTPRAPGPSFLDAVAVLRELGADPQVTAVEIPNRRRFDTLDAAVEHYRDALLLADTEAIRAELADLLKGWLLGRRGALRAPLGAMPAAILQWAPGQISPR